MRSKQRSIRCHYTGTTPWNLPFSGRGGTLSDKFGASSHRCPHLPVRDISFHRAIVGGVSPVLKAAFCRGFKERLVLKETTAETVGTILDFAYGTFEEGQLLDVSLCLQVWKAAHTYQIDFLRCVESKGAMKNSCLEHRVQVLQHAALYGIQQEYEQVLGDFAQLVVENSKLCPDFGHLPFQQLIEALEDCELVASERELLDGI